MLSVVPPSSYNEAEIRKLVHATVKKKHNRPISMPSERIASKNVFWIPYYRVRFEYERSEKEYVQKLGETAQSETAINAMFCGCFKGEDESFTMLRPNYLKYNMIPHSPQSGEVVGPTSHMDFDAFLSGLLKRLNEAKDELYELRTTSNKRYRRIRAYSRILPMTGELREAERSSEKMAKLAALTNVLRMGLNLFEEAASIKPVSNTFFYYPTAVVALEHGEREAERFLIIKLVKSGSVRKRLNLDNGLTQLCNSNDKCKEVLAKSVAQASLGP